MKPSVVDMIGRIAYRRKSLLYDRVNVPAGFILPSNFRLFHIPLGQPDQFTAKLKTARDTNMVLGGMLPAPWDMILFQISLLFQPGIATGVRDAFIGTHTFSCHFLQKRMADAPLPFAASEGFPCDLVDYFGEQTQLIELRDESKDPVPHFERLGRGMSFEFSDGKDLSFAKYLPPLFNFDVSMESDAPFELEGPLDFYVFLHGLMDYPVQ